MGLNEKRKVKELQDVTFVERTKELTEISGGAAIAYEVDWPSIAEDAGALNFIDNISCHRINMALRVICADALGKDAVKAGLKTIRLKNVKTIAEKKLSFSGGVLEIQCAYAEGLSGAFSDNEIRQVLEQGL
jgi:hypothetical protein